MSQTWTILSLLRETEAYFVKKGIASARLDAELLLSHCLQKDRVHLYTDFECPVDDDELRRFRELVKRRAAREPVAYILGNKEFWSIDLKVTPDVLIPRPETEVLVEEALGVLQQRQSSQRVLDIGTGSGAIAVALAKEVPSVSVVGVDISSAALTVAGENAMRNGLQGSVGLVCGDGAGPFRDKGIFDMIVSNPPYIPEADMQHLQPEVRQYEPRAALCGGSEGLDFYTSWIQHFPDYLAPDGWVMLEIGSDQARAVAKLFEETGVYRDIRVVQDYARLDRVVVARKN